MVTILVADDHAVVRRGLKALIAYALHDVEIGEAGNGEEVLAQAKSKPWNLLILDLSMPDQNGLELLTFLHETQPQLRVLVFSIHEEAHYARRALAAGARGYLNKESATEDIIQAIKKVLAGGLYVSDALAQQFARQVGEPTDKLPHESLSDREFEILRMIASGKTVSEIAEERSLAVTTVSTYRSRILEKTRLKTTGELIRYAIDHKLAD